MESLAVDAAQALIDQVLIDGAAGLFNTDPALTFGCDRYVPQAPPYRCSINIPFGFFPVETIKVGRVVNFDAPTESFADSSVPPLPQNDSWQGSRENCRGISPQVDGSSAAARPK